MLSIEHDMFKHIFVLIYSDNCNEERDVLLQWVETTLVLARRWRSITTFYPKLKSAKSLLSFFFLIGNFRIKNT